MRISLGLLLVCILSTPGVGAKTHKVALRWKASTTPNVNYRILRGATHGGPYARVGSTTNLNYVDSSGLSAGVTYYYIVRAGYISSCTVNCVSDASNEVSATIP